MGRDTTVKNKMGIDYILEIKPTRCRIEKGFPVMFPCRTLLTEYVQQSAITLRPSK